MTCSSCGMDLEVPPYEHDDECPIVADEPYWIYEDSGIRGEEK